MRSRCSLVLSCAFALALVPPALAAWTPLLPGWTAHEVPLNNVVLGTSPPESGIALDPVSGKLYVAGFDVSVSIVSSLLRVDALGQVTTVVGQAGLRPPVFDPVHRRLYQLSEGSILVFDENGSPLPPIVDFPQGPLAAGPDGELYSFRWHPPLNSYLDLVRYDGPLSGWVPVKTLSPFPVPWNSEMPTQLLLDASGTLFFFTHDAAAFRVDGTSIVALGARPQAASAAVGPGFLFLGDSFVDPAGSGVQAWTRFAAPTTSGTVCASVGVWPDGSVVFLSANAPVGDGCSLVVFTRDVTPTVHRSWGAVKALAR